MALCMALQPRPLQISHPLSTSSPRARPSPWKPLHRHRRSRLACLASTKQTFGSFDQLINESTTPVLVDFYATWCGPCQMMSQVLNDVSSRMDTIKFVKIDTEKYPTIATKHNIQGLPTLVLFKDGQPVDRIEGYMDAMQLEQRLRYHRPAVHRTSAEMAARDQEDFRQELLSFMTASRQRLQDIQQDPAINPVGSPSLQNTRVPSDLDVDRQPGIIEPSMQGFDPGDHPAKRPRPSSAPNLALPTSQRPDSELRLTSVQQAVEFLAAENKALREQQRQLQITTERVVLENQLLRGILWAYVQLRSVAPSAVPPPARPAASGTSQ